MLGISDNLLWYYHSTEICPAQAADLVKRLGCTLAHLLLKQEILEQALEDVDSPGLDAALMAAQPKPEPKRGLCWVLFAIDRTEEASVLRRSFAIPFRWVQGTRLGGLPPKELDALATQVVSELFPAQKTPKSPPQWQLEPALSVPTDLSGLRKIRCRSAFASLAGGLLVAAADGVPNPTVWASGAWDPNHGIIDVELLEAKLEAVAHLGGRRFFVPDGQLDGIREQAHRHEIELGALHKKTFRLNEALRDYFRELDFPPRRTQGALFRDRASYYLRQHKAEYYHTEILPDLIDHYHRQINGGDSAISRPDHLMMAMSNGAEELVPLMVAICQPRTLWLLYTADSPRFETTKKNVADLVGRTHPEIEVREMPIPRRNHALLRPKELFVSTQPAGKWVFDLTLGTKAMTLMMQGLAQPGDVCCYWEHELEGSHARPGSQELYIQPEGKEAWRLLATRFEDSTDFSS